MTERGQPIVDGAPACPFVAFDDARDDRSDRPDPRHRCYAESPPAPRARAHQEAYCLSASFPVCPMFQDWARREAARVAASGSPAERLREVPARREAGERPPAFGPGDVTPAGGGLGGIVPAADAGDVAADPALSARGGSADRRPDAGSGSHTDDQAAEDQVPAAGGRDPWDVPPRRAVHPEWSAPPPWSPPRPASTGDDADMPGFLRGASVPAGRRPSWPPDAPDAHVGDRNPDAGDMDDGAGVQPESPASREAKMARLRALGMGDVDSGLDDADGIGEAIAAAAPGAAGSAQPGAPGRRGPAGLATAARAGAGAAGANATGVVNAGAAAREPASGGDRRGGGLRGLLGLDGRPRVGASRPPRRAEREPAWERPRRFEAYPTLKTRVGVPMPSRLVLAVAAVLVAAAILFFVPPLFLGKGGSTGSGPTPTPAVAPSGSGAVGSAAPSGVVATARPTPKQKTYTIKQGDTLSTIAKRFGVTVDAILAANKNIKNPNKIAIGDVIVIPEAAPSAVVDGGASASP